MYILKYTQR